MIAAWASLTTGWALTHAWAVIALLVLLLAAAVAFIVVPAIDKPEGRHHAPRPSHPPAWAGVTRAARRAAGRAWRLPGAIGWAWRTPVRTTTSLPGTSPAGSGAPGLSAAGGVPRSARPGTQALGPGAGLSTTPVTTATCSGDIVPLKVDSPVPELAHEDRDGTATAAWLRTLRGPGWTVLALRRQLAVLGALTSGRVTPGHTAARPHGEPGHPAGDPIRCSGYCADGDHSACLANTPWECDCDCHKWDDSDYGLDKAAPVPAFLTAVPPPHDPALWQPRAADETDWSLLAVIAPDLAAERRDAQTQAGA